MIRGTLPASARRVVVRHRGGRATGAVLRVRRRLARKLGAPAAFSAFIVELPLRAAEHPLEVRASDSSAR